MNSNKKKKLLSNQKKFNLDKFLHTEQLEDCDLVIVGLVGLRPILKPEVPLVIRQGMRAGVKIRAITGDSRETITGLGLEAKLISTEELDDPYVCMTGQELVQAC